MQGHLNTNYYQFMILGKTDFKLSATVECPLLGVRTFGELIPMRK